jgi:DNA-binding NarL/FixJ family response regulator
MGMTVVGIRTSADEGLAAATSLRPDLVLVDLGLPDRDGLVLGADILATLPATKIVALTALEDERAVQEALRLGFHGYLTKQTEAEQFKRALESIADGQVVFPHRLGRRNLKTGIERDMELMAAQLTMREREVLQLLAEGASSGQIAERLGVSPNTVRTHVQGILSKLQVHSRLEAAAFAVRHELVKGRS